MRFFQENISTVKMTVVNNLKGLILEQLALIKIKGVGWHWPCTSQILKLCIDFF